MHELFLTAVVPDADIERAQALLQGLSGMSAYASIHRVMFFEGPPQPRGLTVKRSIPTPVQPAQSRLWGELHQQLSRQSYVLQVRYPLRQDEFGEQTPALDGSLPPSPGVSPAAAPGMLRWTDFPDPTSSSGASSIHRVVTQRKKLDIPETRNLPAILTDNNHRFKSELIEESFTFFDSGTEYALVRYHLLPGSVGPPAPHAPQGAPAPLATLPSWDDVTSGSAAAVDPSGQWLFFVRRHVVDDTSPDKMNKALEALGSTQAQLARGFEFRPVDRRAYDTRIERPINNMPAPLPQKIRA